MPKTSYRRAFWDCCGPILGMTRRRTPVRTYLFGAVRNQALKRLRIRERTSDGHAGGYHGSPIASETEALRTEMEGAVAQAVTQLPETQREVLILAHFEQLPLAEIAQALDIEEPAVKSRLQRARAALKETLAAYAPGPERKR